MQLLDRQAVVDEPLRQVFEQLRVGRPLAVDAEVARRVDDAGAEMPFPDAVDDDANRDRFLDDRFGEGRSVAVRVVKLVDALATTRSRSAAPAFTTTPR